MRQAGKSQPYLGPDWGGEDIGTDSQTEVRETRRRKGHRSLGQRPGGMAPGTGQEALGGRSSREGTRLSCSM